MITEYASLPPDMINPAWQWYTNVFADIDTHAANRHLMYRREFRNLATNMRIRKFVATNTDNRILAMSTITNDLHQWPLISPRYFERNWPEHYARHAIYYIGFVGVDRAFAGTGHLFPQLIGAMYPYVIADNGLFVMDYCTTNVRRGVPRLTERVVSNLNASTVITEVDAQHFYVGGFGVPQ